MMMSYIQSSASLIIELFNCINSFHWINRLIDYLSLCLSIIHVLLFQSTGIGLAPITQLRT